MPRYGGCMWLVLSLLRDSLGGWVPGVPETIPARTTPPPYTGRARHGHPTEGQGRRCFV